MFEKMVSEKEGGDSLQGHLVHLTQASWELPPLDKQPHPSPMLEIFLSAPCILKGCLSMALKGSMALSSTQMGEDPSNLLSIHMCIH